MAQKVYAVRQGRQCGIFYTWDECKRQVDSYPGAEYKSFKTIGDAKAYMEKRGGYAKTKVATEKKEVVVDDDTAVAYVDGSYSDDIKAFSCGAILFYLGKEIYFSKKFDDPDMIEMRNVAGEILGAVSVMTYAMENGIKKLVIYYDYQGVEKWATGEWKANKLGTKAYKDFCEDAKGKLDVSFVKVKGHSGDKYNDVADRLAKDALGIK